MECHKNSNAPSILKLYPRKVIPQIIKLHNIFKIQAWADPNVNLPYHARAPLNGVPVKLAHSDLLFALIILIYSKQI